MPNLFRKDPPYDFYHESSAFFHFRELNAEYGSTHKTTFEWLTLMQHYKAPTRVLDWSESLLIGLYFAVSQDQNKPQSPETDGALWILNPDRLNRVSNILDGEFSNIHTVMEPNGFNVAIRAEMTSANSIEALKKRMTPIFRLTASYKPAISQLEALDRPHDYSNSEFYKKLSQPIVDPKRTYV